jgi:hypothetical protein
MCRGYNMKAIIYDHNISELPTVDYYISINYLDKLRLDNENYIYVNKYLDNQDLSYIALHKVYNFSNIKFDDKTVKEIISFDGISLWWFYEPAIRLNYIAYLKYRNMLDNLLGDIDITQIKCNIQDPIIVWAIHNYCAEKNLQFEKVVHKNSSINKYLRYIYFGFEYLMDLLISKIYNTKVHAPVIIASYTNYWTQFDVTKDIQKDGIFHEIQQKLEKSNINYLGIEYNNESIKDYIKTRVEKRRCEKGRWIPLTAYINLNIILKSIKIYKGINSKLSTISMKTNNNEFILNLLKNDIKKSSIFTIIDIYCFSNAIDKIKPAVMLTSCDYCTMGRIATIIGNKKGVTTMALQHGVISDTHWGYIFYNSEKATYTSAIDLRPIPRYTLLYGSKYKDILINNSSYDPDSLIVTGQPRYNNFNNIINSMDKELFIKKNNLKRPLIVWTTQAHGLSEIENKRNIECFSNLLKYNSNINLFIKPHPGETDLFTYRPLVKYQNVTLSKDINLYELFQNVTLSKDINLYELLYACDLMITRHSTTAMEAVALNKPVIILNLSGEPDPVEYVKEGVALGVYAEKDLKPTIEKLLKDDSELAKNRKIYIEKYLYKIDGKATERVVDLITQMVEESGRDTDGK